jgi:hypothetical protein
MDDDGIVRQGESWDPAVRRLQRKLAAVAEERDHYRDLAKDRAARARVLPGGKAPDVNASGKDLGTLVKRYVEKRGKALQDALVARTDDDRERLEASIHKLERRLDELEAKIAAPGA